MRIEFYPAQAVATSLLQLAEFMNAGKPVRVGQEITPAGFED